MLIEVAKSEQSRWRHGLFERLPQRLEYMLLELG
jgi:hypothetical protein